MASAGRSESRGGGWRNVFALGTVSFLTDLSTEMIYPLLPAFLSTVLGAPGVVLGAIEGAAESVASLLKLMSGYYSDRLRGRKGLVFAGYLLSSTAKPLVALATAPWHVAAVRLADRLGKGVRTAPRDSLLADSVQPGQRGKAYGLQRTMDHAGAIVGPLVASGLLGWGLLDLRGVFAAAAIPAAASVLCILLLVREMPRHERTGAAPQAAARVALPPAFRPYLLVVFLFTLGNSSDAFLLLRAWQLGVAPALVPLAWVLLHVVKMASSVPGGIISDKIGRRATIVSGWIVYALVYAGLAAASQAAHVWVLFAVYGLYFGLTEGVEKAYVADLAPARARGRAFGAFNCAIGIGALPASVLMGYLWDTHGAAVAFGTGGALALMASVLLLAAVPGGGQGLAMDTVQSPSTLQK